MVSAMSELNWPPEFDRTPPSERESYPHGFRVTRAQAIDNVLEELRKMGARHVQLSTGAEHQTRDPNRPYANASFDDPGVVARFERGGTQYAIPCDRWDNPRDNAQAIARYIDAKRAIERYGVATIESEFKTAELPPADETSTEGTSTEEPIATPAPPASDPPHEVLDVSPDAPAAVVRGAFRALANKHHPDHGGSDEAFKRLVEAKEAMLR